MASQVVLNLARQDGGPQLVGDDVHLIDRWRKRRGPDEDLDVALVAGRLQPCGHVRDAEPPVARSVKVIGLAELLARVAAAGQARQEDCRDSECKVPKRYALAHRLPTSCSEAPGPFSATV